MKKKIKIVVIIFLASILVPLLFFNKGSAEEYPIATPDNADFELIMEDQGKQDLINNFNFFKEMQEGSSTLGQIGKLAFDMKFEVQYIQNFLAISTSEVGFQGFTVEQVQNFMQLYELCWLHLILETLVSLVVAAGFYKFLKNNLQ